MASSARARKGPEFQVAAAMFAAPFALLTILTEIFPLFIMGSASAAIHIRPDCAKQSGSFASCGAYSVWYRRARCERGNNHAAQSSNAVQMFWGQLGRRIECRLAAKAATAIAATSAAG